MSRVIPITFAAALLTVGACGPSDSPPSTAATAKSMPPKTTPPMTPASGSMGTTGSTAPTGAPTSTGMTASKPAMTTGASGSSGAMASSGSMGSSGATGVKSKSMAASTSATATLSPTAGHDVRGTVTFTRQGAGVMVHLSLTGLTPGEHGFHVHEKGDCSSSDGMSAGDHFNAEHSEHGGPQATVRHTGDLGNIVADAQGKVESSFVDERIALDGADSIIGRAVIVHEKADDLTSQPGGNAGARLACGVIEAATAPAANAPPAGH